MPFGGHAWEPTFYKNVTLNAGPAPVRACIAELLPDVLEGRIQPGRVFDRVIGLWWNGRLAVDVDFGLGADHFTFVPYDHFWDYNLHAWLLPHERLAVVFRGSFIRNSYHFDHGRFFVGGIDHEHMVVLTHHEIRIAEPAHHDEFHGHYDSGRHDFHDDHWDRHGR
jgi:hypothetical protein